MSLLLAVIVALRVIAAPLVVAAPQPGLIAICSGGQIHYVSFDGTPVEPDAPAADTCPFLGITLALADPVPAIPMARTGRTGRLQPVPFTAHVPARTVPGNPARAPPLSA